MKALRFEGHSDDTFACVGDGIDVDLDNCASGEPICMLVKSPSQGMAIIVTGQYAPGETTGWQIAAAPALLRDTDEHNFPTWAMGFEPGDAPYSPRLVILAPDDITVELMEE